MLQIPTKQNRHTMPEIYWRSIRKASALLQSVAPAKHSTSQLRVCVYPHPEGQKVRIGMVGQSHGLAGNVWPVWHRPSAYLRDASGKCLGDWSVFYGQTSLPNSVTCISMVLWLHVWRCRHWIFQTWSHPQDCFVLTINEALERNLNFAGGNPGRYIYPHSQSGFRSGNLQFYADDRLLWQRHLHDTERFIYITQNGNSMPSENGVARDPAGLCQLYGVENKLTGGNFMLTFETVNELTLKVTSTGNDYLYQSRCFYRTVAEIQTIASKRFSSGPQKSLVQAALGSLMRRVTRENIPWWKQTFWDAGKCTACCYSSISWNRVRLSRWIRESSRIYAGLQIKCTLYRCRCFRKVLPPQHLPEPEVRLM